MNATAKGYLRSEGRGLLAVLAVFVALVAVPYYFEWKDRQEIDRQCAAPIYALPYDVSATIEDGALHFTGISRKLEDCTVPKGSAVTLAAEIATGGPVNQVRGYPALHSTGEQVLSAPLVTKDREFVIGPFMIHDRPGVLRRIVSVTVNLDCEFLSTGVRRSAIIGPIEIRPPD